MESIHGHSITDAEISFQLIFNELLKEVNESFTLKIYKQRSTLNDLFEKGDLQVILTNSLNFLDLDSLIHPTARYAVQYGGSLKQPYLLLVRRTNKLVHLKYLRGKKLSLANGHLIGKLFLDVQLLENGLPSSDNFFGEIVTVKGANTSIIDLYFGKIDAALVPQFSLETALELNPQIKDKVEILAVSKPMIYQAVGVRHDFPQSRIDNFEPSIITENPGKRLKQVFNTFRIVRLHRITDNALSEVKDLVKHHNKLIGQER